MERKPIRSVIGDIEVDSAGTYISRNPATGETLAEIELAGKEGLSAAIKTARNSFESWKKIPFNEKKSLLKSLSNLLLENVDEIANLITSEQGKPINESMSADTIPVLDNLKYLIRKGGKHLRPRKVDYTQPLLAHKKGRIVLEPRGVVAVISPWNFPLSIPMLNVLHAVFCGNTVVLKPALETVLIGLKIGELFREAGFPPGVVNVVAVDDEVAPALTSSPDVDLIIFTGSTSTGRKVMASAATNLTPVILELGGKDPVIVADDADLDRAVEGVVWGGFNNAGQVCVSAERVYIQAGIYDEFLSRVLKKVSGLRVGDPTDPNVDIGAMCSEISLRKVEEHIEDAVDRGARIESGGARLEPGSRFFPPTVLTNVDHGMRIMKEETFGPVLPLMKVDSIDEALSLASHRWGAALRRSGRGRR